MAVGHDLAVTVQLREAGRQLGDRNQHGAVDAGNLVLVRLAHVDHEQIGVFVPFLFQVLRRDLRAVVRRLGPDAAERLVVDQPGDGRVGPAHRAVRLFRSLELAELQLEGVEQDETPDQRLTHAQNQLDGLHRLNRPDDPGQHAEHTAFRAGRHEPRRRRLRVEAAVTGALCRVKHGGLAFEAEDRSVHVGLAEQHARVVHEVARREVVRPVRDDVEVANDVERIVRRQPRLERLHAYIGIQVVDTLLGGLELGYADGGRPVQHLALEIGLVDDVEIDDAQGADARRGEIQRGWRPQSARGHEQLQQLADVAAFQLERVAAADVGAQRRGNQYRDCHTAFRSSMVMDSSANVPRSSARTQLFGSPARPAPTPTMTYESHGHAWSRSNAESAGGWSGWVRNTPITSCPSLSRRDSARPHQDLSL